MSEDTPKRRRKKSEPERINLDEWGSAGALDGLLSFLNIPPQNAPINQGPRKVLNLLEQRLQANQSKTGTLSVIDTVPVIDDLVENAPEGVAEAVAEAGHGQTDIPVIDTVPVIDPVVEPIPAWHPKQTTGFGNKKLYYCKLAQDGHSHTEEALYQVLWRSGKTESDDTRLAVMGYGEMAKRLRLSFNNTKYACQRLIAKMALEEVAREVSDIRQGKTYRVFSYKAILERRKACGMEWVIRNKGVEFVTPEFCPGTILGTVPVIAITDTVPDIPITGTVSITDTLSITGRGTLSITGTPTSRKENREYKESSSSSDLAAVLAALSEYGQPDDDAARSLLEKCRNVAPESTVSEILHFMHQKGAMVRQDRSGRILSPIGFLLTAVPKCFMGETFTRYQQEKRKQQESERVIRERQEAEVEQWRREQELTLSDPNASEEDKRFARQVLGLEN
jgi:hypothetical protein